MARTQKAYKKVSKSIDPSKRDDLILTYAPQIKFIANRLAMRLPPHVELDDLISAGVIGLMDAAEKYDAGRNIQFKTYAEFRIKGAMLDELRAQDWVPRSVRQKASLLEKTYAEIEQNEARPATDEEVAYALNMDMEEFYDLLNRARGISLVSLESGEEQDMLSRRILEPLNAGTEENPLAILRKKELKQILGHLIEELPENERIVVSLYYYEELTMKEIGKTLDITESRVSQIHTQAMLRLRGKLSKALS
jgi:RNA polymerase sigma factor for flagellar operon FliA